MSERQRVTETTETYPAIKHRDFEWACSQLETGAITRGDYAII